MSKYGLVAIGYNRPNSLNRLLISHQMRIMMNRQIVSIDRSKTDECEKTAEKFHWLLGEKRIITFQERQGLRKHIFRCGDFVQDYEYIAVFEDDVVAALGFFMYMKRTVEKYGDDNRISLLWHTLLLSLLLWQLNQMMLPTGLWQFLCFQF